MRWCLEGVKSRGLLVWSGKEAVSDDSTARPMHDFALSAFTAADHASKYRNAKPLRPRQKQFSWAARLWLRKTVWTNGRVLCKSDTFCLQEIMEKRGGTFIEGIDYINDI